MSQNGCGNGYESDGDPTPRGVVGFVFLLVMSSSAVRRCPGRDAQHAESSAPSCAVRGSVKRDVQHADIPVLFSASRRSSKRDVPACRQLKLLGSSARFVARIPSSGAQVAYEDSVRFSERCSTRDAPLSRARPYSTRSGELFLSLFSRSF